VALFVDDCYDHVFVAIVVEIGPDRGIAAVIRIEAEGVIDALEVAFGVFEEDVVLAVARDVEVLPAIVVEVHHDDGAAAFEEIRGAKTINAFEIDDAGRVCDIDETRPSDR